MIDLIFLAGIPEVFNEVEVFEKLGVKFFWRLIIDLLSVFVIVRVIYFRIYKKNDFFFTYFLFNLVIFIITYLLNKVDLSLGAAFGLFAVFSLLRYRTENISAKDMTYLFVVIAIGLISSVTKGTYLDTIMINLIIIGFVYLLDGSSVMKNEQIKKIQYENINLIRPENRELLIEDLKKRTGLNIHKVNIGKVDFLKDTATIKIFYYDNNHHA